MDKGIGLKLVLEKRNDCFTTSDIIAKEIGVKNRNIYILIEKYINDLKELGVLSFEMIKPNNKNGGRPIKNYFLNEQQATLLITYLRNTEIVRKFKLSLVKQFYQMREFIRHKQTSEYKQIKSENTNNNKQCMEQIKGGTQENFIKAHTIANKAVSIQYGLDKMINENEMTSEQLQAKTSYLQLATTLLQAKKQGANIKSISEIVYATIKKGE